MTTVYKWQYKSIGDRYLRKESVRDIAFDYGVSRTCIYRVLLKLGIEKLPRKRKRNIPKNKVPDNEVSIYLKATYGITLDNFRSMTEIQGGRCLICGEPVADRPSSRTHVDHCHNTMEVRGVVCDFCNRGLSGFRDDPKNLARAIIYLEAGSYDERIKDLIAAKNDELCNPKEDRDADNRTQSRRCS